MPLNRQLRVELPDHRRAAPARSASTFAAPSVRTISVDQDIHCQSFCANGMYSAGTGASSAAVRARITDDADDLHPRAGCTDEADARADRIASGPEESGQRLVDDHDRCGIRAIRHGERAAATHGNAHDPEVIAGDDAERLWILTAARVASTGALRWRTRTSCSTSVPELFGRRRHTSHVRELPNALHAAARRTRRAAPSCRSGHAEGPALAVNHAVGPIAVVDRPPAGTPNGPQQSPRPSAARAIRPARQRAATTAHVPARPLPPRSPAERSTACSDDSPRRSRPTSRSAGAIPNEQSACDGSSRAHTRDTIPSIAHGRQSRNVAGRERHEAAREHRRGRDAEQPTNARAITTLSVSSWRIEPAATERLTRHARRSRAGARPHGRAAGSRCSRRRRAAATSLPPAGRAAAGGRSPTMSSPHRDDVGPVSRHELRMLARQRARDRPHLGVRAARASHLGASRATTCQL